MLARILIRMAKCREERAEMKQHDPFRLRSGGCGTASRTCRVRWALELGLAVFIGLCALQLHHLLAIATP